MFDQISPNTSANVNLFAPLRQFADAHRDAMINAAERLGGRPGTRLALDALDSLAPEIVPTRRTQNNFVALLDLLSLEHVHDETREEAARFAEIDPCDSIVEEICVLTDGLRDALERATTDHRPASRRAAA
ncbi:hypothetical protein [Limimaricola litoreus]|uniref:Uncharacterized protein n=1 Tax=Limimaricola litoreus TaxID=2955316 RepID=A0A9X2FSQ6_9RHOB|nr:hypothetical protein [Limimaricola litoreus]MCP1167676.1 hypothetical protein [Limimaricola litoreus]